MIDFAMLPSFSDVVGCILFKKIALAYHELNAIVIL